MSPLSLGILRSFGTSAIPYRWTRPMSVRDTRWVRPSNSYWNCHYHSPLPLLLTPPPPMACADIPTAPAKRGAISGSSSRRPGSRRRRRWRPAPGRPRARGRDGDGRRGPRWRGTRTGRQARRPAGGGGPGGPPPPPLFARRLGCAAGARRLVPLWGLLHANRRPPKQRSTMVHSVQPSHARMLAGCDVGCDGWHGMAWHGGSEYECAYVSFSVKSMLKAKMPDLLEEMP